MAVNIQLAFIYDHHNGQYGYFSNIFESIVALI